MAYQRPTDSSVFDRKIALIQKLTVVDCPRKLSFEPEVIAWRKARPEMMFVPNSCIRQLWLGSEADFSEFPLALKQPGQADYKRGIDPIIHKGKEAYRYLLSLICGLETGIGTGETNIAGQFYDGWAKFVTANSDDKGQSSEKLKDLVYIVQSLSSDSGYVRTHYIDMIKPQRKSMAAVRLSGQQARDSVVVIGRTGGGTQDFGLSPSTYSLGCDLANNRPTRVSSITVCHPDPQKAEEIFYGYVHLQAAGKIAPDVSLSVVDFKDLPSTLCSSQRLFIDCPMGEDRDIDDSIIAACQNTANKALTIVNMFSTNQYDGKTPDYWRNANLPGFSGPEDIVKHLEEVAVTNERMRSEGSAFIDYCTERRADGQAPNRKLCATGEWKNHPAKAHEPCCHHT